MRRLCCFVCLRGGVHGAVGEAECAFHGQVSKGVGGVPDRGVALVVGLGICLNSGCICGGRSFLVFQATGWSWGCSVRGPGRRGFPGVVVLVRHSV